MARLNLIIADTVDVDALEDEVVTAIADRLRDEHGYELRDAVSSGDADAEREYALLPSGGITVRRRTGGLVVKLRGVDVDADDLFTGVSSELEQRHDGLRVELD